MRWKSYFFVALVVGAVAGSWIKKLPGFVIIVYDQTSYEMRLWVAVCLLLLLLATLYLLGAFLRSLTSGANWLSSWHGGRTWRKARKLTVDGILAYAEGRWADSENNMKKAAKISDYPLINYLFAAQSAQQQDAEVRRDAYLKLAYETEPSARTAIGLTQAQLQLQHNQFEQALASLNELRLANPSHPYVLKLLARIYLKLQEWQQLAELLPQLRKYNALSPSQLEVTEQKTVAGLLAEAATKDLGAVQACWQALPANLRKLPQSILCFARQLARLGEMDEAERTLRPLIKKSATGEVIALYGSIDSNHAQKQHSFLESWHQTQQNAPDESFLALGKLAFKAKLWGKAQASLEQSMRAAPTAECYLFMARTLDQLEQPEEASDYYQQGLELLVDGKPSNDIKALAREKIPALASSEAGTKFQKL